jgi:hypothetical protein
LKFLKPEDKEIPRLRQYKIPNKLSNRANHILKTKRKVIVDFEKKRKTGKLEFNLFNAFLGLLSF